MSYAYPTACRPRAESAVASAVIQRVSEAAPDHSGTVVLMDGNGNAALGSFDRRESLWNIDGRFFGLDEWPFWMSPLGGKDGAE